MPKPSTYQQYLLEKQEGTSRLIRVTWGPSEFATVGKEVKIEEDDGSWSYGWIVKSVSEEKIDAKIAQHRSHDYTRQRAASDI